MPLDQYSWQQQVKALENYLVHAVLNLQTLERAQVSPLHSLKQTPNASKELLATELEQSIEQNRMRLSEALKYYASLANLEGKPDSFAYARDRSLALASSVVTETERCFERTFRSRLLEGTLPADLNDRLHAVRYLRESAQKLAAFVERKNYDLAVDLSQTVLANRAQQYKASNGGGLGEKDESRKLWDATIQYATNLLPALREQALQLFQSVLDFTNPFYRTGRDGITKFLRVEDLNEFELTGMQATLEESLDAARLQLQDAEFLAAVLDIHVRETIEAMNLILALEGEGIIEEMTADLRLLARHDPKTAEQPIMIPNHVEDWDHPGPCSLITIEKRIQSLTGFPDIIRFLHYEGKLLLANPGSASPARPEQMPLPLLRAHVRLLRQTVRLHTVQRQLTWLVTCDGYLPLSLIERTACGPCADDTESVGVLHTVEALEDLIEARESSRPVAAGAFPSLRDAWEQAQELIRDGERRLSTAKMRGCALVSTVSISDGKVGTVYGSYARGVPHYLLMNRKQARDSHR